MKTTAKVFGAAALAAGVALTAGAPASAHHSGAMFDNTKSVTLTGVIKEFKWQNPHAFIQVMSPDAAGATVEWSVECSTPNILLRRGWAMHSLNPGDKVTLTMHPLKDGGNAGEVLTVTTASGAVLKDHDQNNG
jgi:hypothetical protein